MLNGEKNKNAEFINNSGTIKATIFFNLGTFIHNGEGYFEGSELSGMSFFSNEGDMQFYGNFTIKPNAKPTMFGNYGTMYIAGGVTLTTNVFQCDMGDHKCSGNSGTITFGFKDGKAALWKGMLVVASTKGGSPTNGKLVVETDGMVFNTKYQIIDGEVVFDDELNIEFKGTYAASAKYEIKTTGYKGLYVWLQQGGGSGGGGQNPEKPDPENPDTEQNTTKPDNPMPEPTPSQSSVAQSPNYEIIKSTLANKMLVYDTNTLNQAAKETDKTLKTSLIAQPKNILKAFKSDTLSTPLNSAYVSRLTASSRAIMNDSSNFINPLERQSQTQFFASPFGGVLKGNDLNGYLAGLSVGLTDIGDDYIGQAHFAYAKGKSTQDLSTQSTELNANLFQVGGFGCFSMIS